MRGIVVVVGVLVGCGKPSDRPATSWQWLGVHPQAIEQPTEVGKTLRTLCPWRGQLYLGYGDYQDNTGPIAITAWDPTTRNFETKHASDTEAIYTLRAIGDALYAPATDRRAHADYAVGPPWHDVQALHTAHASDMASLGGDDLWLVGSSEGRDDHPDEWRATAWHSIDRGAHWTIGHQRPGNGRYYFAATFRGALYVQGWARQPDDHAEIFDGATWRAGPNLLPYGGNGRHPIELSTALGGELLYATRETFGTAYPWLNATPNQLLAFDGARVRVAFEPPIVDFFADDREVLVLDGDGGVWQSSDLAHWTAIAGAAELHPQSLAMLDGALYIGTTDAQLYRLRGWP